MTKHTPGPWKVYRDTDGTRYIISETSPREANTIATVSSAYRNRAGLIAAAPDLLEALMYSLEDIPTPEGYNKAKSAIEKATS